jgi:hypothetical protein
MVIFGSIKPLALAGPSIYRDVCTVMPCIRSLYVEHNNSSDVVRALCYKLTENARNDMLSKLYSLT